MIKINNLGIVYNNKESSIKALNNINIEIKKGEFVGIVGESGSGKSTIVDSILGLLSHRFEQKGNILFQNEVISKENLKQIRGHKISYIGQNFYKSLSDFFTIENHFKYFYKSKLSKKMDKNALVEIKKMLNDLKIENPNKILKQYPFELSGGMIQRVCISLALLNDPTLLIADEPTSAIDTIAKKEFIKTLKSISLINKMSVLIISHDLELVFDFCDKIYVLHKGNIVESGKSANVYNSHFHPYTELLINAKKNKASFLLKENKHYHNNCSFSRYCPIIKENCFSKKVVKKDNYVVYCSEREC